MVFSPTASFGTRAACLRSRMGSLIAHDGIGPARKAPGWAVFNVHGWYLACSPEDCRARRRNSELRPTCLDRPNDSNYVDFVRAPHLNCSVGYELFTPAQFYFVSHAIANLALELHRLEAVHDLSDSRDLKVFEKREPPEQALVCIEDQLHSNCVRQISQDGRLYVED